MNAGRPSEADSSIVNKKDRYGQASHISAHKAVGARSVPEKLEGFFYMAWMRPELSQTKDVAVLEVSIRFLTSCPSVGTSRALPSRFCR